MRKAFYQHDLRMAEARPDIMAMQQRVSASMADDNVFSGFSPSKAVIRDKFFVANTTEVDEVETDAVLLGIRKLLDEIQSRIALSYSADMSMEGAQFGSPDWYQENALMEREAGFGQQVNASKLYHLMQIEPQQIDNPHFDFLVLDKDLTKGFLGIDYIYGTVKYPSSLLSIRRLREKFPNLSTYKSALSLISAQQTARLMGLPRRNFNGKAGELIKGYCNGETGPCLLEPLEISGATIERQISLIAGRTSWLCADCLEEAEYRRNDLQRKEIIW